MNRSIKILSGGLGANTSIVDSETGKELNLLVEKVAVEITSQDFVRADIHVACVRLDVEVKDPGYYLPIFGEDIAQKRVAKVVFEDGSELSINGLNVKG